MFGVSTQQWPSTEIILFERTSQSAWLEAVTTPLTKSDWILVYLNNSFLEGVEQRNRWPKKPENALFDKRRCRQSNASLPPKSRLKLLCVCVCICTRKPARTHTRTRTHTHAQTQWRKQLLRIFGPESSRWREHFRVFLAIFWLLNSLQRGIFVHKNSLASCQRYLHSVQSRALTCPFKQSYLSAWSLLNWHPTHTYFWGRLCFNSSCLLPLSQSSRVN